VRSESGAARGTRPSNRLFSGGADRRNPDREPSEVAAGWIPGDAGFA